MSNFLRHMVGSWLTTTLLLLIGCGGSESDTPTEAVAQLEVTPTAVLFSGTGQHQALTVRAFGASGAEIRNAPITFTSSRPEQVSVDATGTVTAVGPVGSAQITISSGAVSAAPITAIAAETYPGTVLVSDEQLSTAPQPVSSTAAGIGSQYTVGIRGIAPPPIGTIILASGSASVAGKVVSVSAADNGTIAATLEVIPIPQLFRNLSVSQIFTPAQVAQLMRPASTAADKHAAAANSPSVGPLAAIRFGKFSCTPTFDAALLQLDLAPSIEQRLGAAIDLSVLNGVSKSLLIQLDGSITGNIAGSVTVGSVKGEVKCQAPIYNIQLPVFGALSVLFSPAVPLGVGFKLDLDASSNLSLGVDGSFSANLTFGIKHDANGQPVNINKGSIDGKIDLTPSEFNPSGRVQFSASAGPTAGITVSTLMFTLPSAIDVSAGPEFASSWAAVYDAAHDHTFTSEDQLAAKLEISAGDGLKESLGLVGHIAPVGFDLSANVSTIIGSSPRLDSVRLSQNSFQVGDAMKFTLTLDPTTIRFPLGLGAYNVQELRIYTLDPTAPSATLIASATAADGQSEFTLPWTATVTGSVGTVDNPHFFAFVVPRLLSSFRSGLPAELGPVQGPSIEIKPEQVVLLGGSNAQFDAYVAGSKTTAGIAWSATGGTIDAQGGYSAGSAAGTFEVRALRLATGEVAISQVTVLQAAPTGFTISGTVVDELSKSIAGAKVALTSNGTTYSAITDASGFYYLHITDAQAAALPAGFVVNASEPIAHNPSSKTLTAADTHFVRADFVLLTISGNPGLLSIELVPEVHHLGNGSFAGTANSQFQFPNAEGAVFQRSFSVTPAHKAFSSAKIVLNAKGIECANEIWVNSSRVTTLGASASSGAFSRYEITLLPSTLAIGPTNVFKFVAITCVGPFGGIDMDDFEFSNVQIWFQ